MWLSRAVTGTGDCRSENEMLRLDANCLSINLVSAPESIKAVSVWVWLGRCNRTGISGWGLTVLIVARLNSDPPQAVEPGLLLDKSLSDYLDHHSINRDFL